MSCAISAADARADRILNRSAEIVQRSLVYMPGDLFWEQRYGERGRRFAHEDGAYHVRYLADAIRAGSMTVMQAYARWLRDLLVPRGMCTLHLSEHLQHIGEAAAATLGDGPEKEYVDAAIEALKYDEGPPREIQDAAIPLEAELAPLSESLRRHTRHSAFETRYLCHYAADAAHRDNPGWLAAHIDWSRNAFAELGGEASVFDRWVDVVKHALAKKGLPESYF